MSTYANFNEAITSGSRVKVVGVLAGEKPMEYNPEKNPNIFKFYMKDNKGEERQIVLSKAKFQDFERTRTNCRDRIDERRRFYADEPGKVPI